MDTVVVALVAITASTADLGSGGSRPLAVSLALAAAAATALVWRRSRPLVVTGAVVLLGVVSLASTGSLGGLEIALAFALYAVAASRRGGTAWLAASAAFAALVAAVWI